MSCMICCILIADQPGIITHPQNHTATEGYNVTLSCDATGNPLPTLLWTKDGSLVNASVNFRISLSSDRKQLTITNVNRADSGQYRCVANNSVGTVTSNAATLDVHCKYSGELRPIDRNMNVSTLRWVNAPLREVHRNVLLNVFRFECHK